MTNFIKISNLQICAKIESILCDKLPTFFKTSQSLCNFSILTRIRVYEWLATIICWFRLYKNEKSQGKISVIETQFTTIMKENEIKLNERRRSKHGNASNKLRGFLKPTGWKPMTILFFFFAFQQFSGIYITLFYAVTWFQVIK